MTKVTPEQFVKAYMKRGGDKAAIADELNMSAPTVYARIVAYRKAGVKLPIPRKRGTRIDVKGLNELIRSSK